jgi:hypothetical protein
MSRQHAVLIVGDPIRKKTGLVGYAEKKISKEKTGKRRKEECRKGK